MPKLTIDLSDDEAHALAMLAGSLNQLHYEYATRWWQVLFTGDKRALNFDKAALAESMNKAKIKLYRALAETGFDIWPVGTI